MTYNLQQRLNDCASGECGSATLLHELFVLCDSTPDYAWDILSLVDQYYRRGKLSSDLFQTLRCKIERHALGIRDDDMAPEICSTRTGTGANIGAIRGGSLAIQEQAATAEDLAGDIRASSVEPSYTREAVHPSRKRVRSLPAFRNRTRRAVVYRQPASSLLTTKVGRYFKRRRYGERRNGVLEAVNREPRAPLITANRKGARSLVLGALLLGVGLSPVLQDFTLSSSSGKMASPAAPALLPNTAAVTATPKVVRPGKINLSTERYIVFPGHPSADIAVERTGGTNGDVSFVWWTEGAGAKPGSDYVPRQPRVAHMADGVEALHLSVPILANRSRKHTELFYVVIGKPGGGASLGSTRRAVVFILSRD